MCTLIYFHHIDILIELLNIIGSILIGIACVNTVVSVNIMKKYFEVIFFLKKRSLRQPQLKITNPVVLQ